MIQKIAEIFRVAKCVYLVSPLCAVYRPDEEPPFNDKVLLAPPRCTHSKHKHLIRTLSFRRHIRAKIPNEISRRVTTKHAGSKTVKLRGKELFISDFPSEPKLESVVLFVYEVFMGVAS